ncbi:MAG: amino acid ABC transporter permease [Pseudomonadota bacterium]
MAVTSERPAILAPPRPPWAQRVTGSTGFAVALYALVMGALIYGAYAGAAQMGYNWQWYNIPRYLWTYTEDGFQLGELVAGLGMTFVLSVGSFILAVVVGMLMALARLSDLVIGKGLAIALLEFLRNMPLLVLVYLFYYVLGPIFGWDRVTSSILCLGVFHGALLSEIFRAGILSVPKGQWEGAESIGMTRGQSYRYIILPQSVPLMLPPLTGEAIQLVKSSAIVSVIAVAELTTVGRNLISDTYMSFEIWFTVAVIYLVITLTMSFGVTALEKRVAHN